MMSKEAKIIHEEYVENKKQNEFVQNGRLSKVEKNYEISYNIENDKAAVIIHFEDNTVCFKRSGVINYEIKHISSSTSNILVDINLNGQTMQHVDEIFTKSITCFIEDKYINLCVEYIRQEEVVKGFYKIIWR